MVMLGPDKRRVALYEDGQLSKALKMQKKAIKHAKDKAERKMMEVHLEEYRDGVQ